MKISRGTSHPLADGRNVLTSEVTGEEKIVIVSDHGSCFDAAFLAHFMAARIARSQGIMELVIRNSNRHVVNWLNHVWKVRSPAMRRYRDAFERAFSDMKITHQY